MKTTLLLLVSTSMLTCEQLDVPHGQLQPCAPTAFESHPNNELYMTELTHYRQDTGSPGSLMLIQKAGEALWIGAVGKANLESQANLRVCDPFRTASITKLFVSVAILKLQERNQLQIDEPLDKLLPDLKGRIPQANQITVKHLLSHTSGIVDPANEDPNYQLAIVNNPQEHFALTTDQLLSRYVYGKPLRFAPGTRYSYSNTGFLLLGQIIERQTGQQLQDVLDEWIFRPLRLNNTYLEARDDRNVVRGYKDVYGNGRMFDVSQWDRADSDGQADGGIISTAADLAVFMDALFTGKLLTESSLKQMLAPVLLPTCPNGDCEYGLGIEHWKTAAGLAYGHNGTSAGVEINLLYFPQNKSVFLLFKNRGNGSDKSLLDRLMK